MKNIALTRKRLSMANNKPRKFNPLVWFIAYNTLAKYLQKAYNVTGVNHDLVRTLQPPYLIVANHVTLWDPPIVASFIRHRIHFVMSDANLRSSIGRWLYLHMAAVIPKTKARSDSSTVRSMIKLARNKRIICVFPEGRSSWDGLTHDIFFSTSKLIKALKIPVVAPLIKGGYLSRPRWGHTRRNGRMEIEFQKLFDGPELPGMSVEEIHEKLTRALENNDYDFQQQSGITFTSKKGAEYLERLLFVCPSCRSMVTMESKGNNFTCTRCNFTARYTETGELVPENAAEYPLRRIYEWSAWQNDFLTQFLKEKKTSGNTSPIFQDTNVTIKTGYKFARLKHHMTGTLSMFLDRFEMADQNGHTEIYAFSDVYGIQVLLANRLEFYCRDILYKCEFDRKNISGYKYMLAAQKIIPDKTELE